MADLNFVEAYRDMQPAASRDVIVAREASYKTILKDAPKDITKLLDLVRLYFDLSPIDDTALDNWFGKALRQKDKVFSLQRDKEEAARIAALGLLGIVQNGFPVTPALVVAASFSGKRRTLDDGRVVSAAVSALADNARTRGLGFTARVPNAKLSTAAPLATITAGSDPAAIKTALEAVGAEYKSALSATVTGVNQALEDLVRENRRLAEEVDLLWWHLGGWSYLLNAPLKSIDPLAVPIVIGNDVASMISTLPGPHGALGIIRQALGDGCNEEQKLSDTLRALPSSSRAVLLNNFPAGGNDIAPLHFGLRALEFEASGPSQASVFKRSTQLSFDIKLTRFEIARQAFYERMFIKHGWLR